MNSRFGLVRSLAIGLAGALIDGLFIPWGFVHVLELSERQTRPYLSRQELLKLEGASDNQSKAEMRMAHSRVVERAKTEYDRYVAGERKEPPVINILVISGGGDYGAFGAGFLKGWRKVPPQHPLAKPEFDAVTGVSAGTLIAPFAFLDDERSIDQIVDLFRNPKTDWLKELLLYLLPANVSFDEIPGLERDVRNFVNMEMVRRIAKAGADGRILAVNTTNVDQGTSRVFNLVSEAEHAVVSGRLDRFHSILLASAGIPGVFPFRMIDGELYVDGGTTGNIVYGGRRREPGIRKSPPLWNQRMIGPL